MIRRLTLASLVLIAAAPAAAQQFRRITARDYRNKMIAGWIGQMAGVTWGLPVEFRYNDEKVPECMVPKWDPVQINDALTNDDVFNDSRLLYLIDKYGLDITARQAEVERWLVWGPDARSSLLAGVAPPDLYRRAPQVGRRQGLGFQISADVLGLIAPGLPNTSISLAERLTNPYGDSLYGGQFIAAMYGEAFFETSIHKIIQAGLNAIPEDSTYAGMVRDVVLWHRANPQNWDRTWQLIHDKYTPPSDSDSRGRRAFEELNMDVLRNGGYVLLGLLYGERDLDGTIVKSMRGGDDADCNPANAAGVVFTTVGYSKLPERFRYTIDRDKPLTYDYGRQRGVLTYPEVLERTEKVARAAIVKAGGRIERDGNGEEVFIIPVQPPRPSRLYRAGDAIPVTDSRFTADEMQVIRGTTSAAANEFARQAPGWELSGQCELGFLPYVNYRSNVFITYPAAKTSTCTFSRKYQVPDAGFTTFLDLSVSHPNNAAFILIAKVDGQEVLHMNVTQSAGAAVAAEYNPPWQQASADLTPWAGKKVKIELLDQPGRWENPIAYWKQITLTSSATTGRPRKLGLWDNSGESFRHLHNQQPRRPD